MKIVFKHLRHRPSASFTALIEQHLQALGQSLQIDEARVLIERRLQAGPAFRISAHLATPGPDIFAEAMGHTLHGALQTTVAKLETGIEDAA